MQHKIILKPDASPCIHKARNIPLTLRDDVKKELEKLVSMGIIEAVESSQWVAPFVVARKPNGKLRLCVDLRDLNKNILVDQFPLSKINEMLSLTKRITGLLQLI